MAAKRYEIFILSIPSAKEPTWNYSNILEVRVPPNFIRKRNIFRNIYAFFDKFCRLLVRGELLPFWQFLVTYVRDFETVVDIRKNLVLNQVKKSNAQGERRKSFGEPGNLRELHFSNEDGLSQFDRFWIPHYGLKNPPLRA